MSPDIWTRCAGASRVRPLHLTAWRAVEAQHQVSTRKLVDSLEEQALLPIQSPVEMGMSLPALVTKLSATEYYPVLFQAAFGTPEITPERIGKAIAQFERSMVSYKSKYDTAFTDGIPNPNFAAVFSPQELQGEQLFHHRCFMAWRQVEA